MIQIQVDTQGQMVAIGQRLERLAFEAPDVLRLSLNAAARQVRKQLTRDVADTYTVDASVLKDSSKGAPRLQTAKPGRMEAVIYSKGPMLDLLEFMVRDSDRGVQAKVLESGSLKFLERGGAPAFIGQFENGHRAVLQRQVGQTYTMAGAQVRIQRYGMPTDGKWPDLTRIKKLLGPAVTAALQAKTEGICGVFRAQTYIDIGTDKEKGGAAVYTEVRTAKEKQGVTSAFAAALWPMVAVGSKIYAFSAMLAPLTATVDAGNDDVPYESPSNKDLRITGTVLQDGTEVLLDQQQANDLLNANGVITAINASGWKAWGNNTAAYPSTTDPKDRFLAVRRFFSWDANNFILTYFQKVDNPANTRLVQSIVDSQNIKGNGYVARDYVAGYRCEFREEENPVTDLLNGHLTTHTFLAPYTPAEYIENINEYDTAALEAALTGGDAA